MNCNWGIVSYRPYSLPTSKRRFTHEYFKTSSSAHKHSNVDDISRESADLGRRRLQRHYNITSYPRFYRPHMAKMSSPLQMGHSSSASDARCDHLFRKLQSHRISNEPNNDTPRRSCSAASLPRANPPIFITRCKRLLAVSSAFCRQCSRGPYWIQHEEKKIKSVIEVKSPRARGARPESCQTKHQSLSSA
eukprot:5715005-Pleurochrysis_carterae.AAC.2